MAETDGGQEATDGEIRLDCVEAIKQMKQESKDARWPREQEWNTAWNLYNGEYDFSAKAAWQSRGRLPRVNSAVRTGAQLLKKGLVGPKDFFSTEGLGPIGKQMAPYIHDLTKFHLRTGEFTKNYSTAIISGMLTSLVIMKVYPQIAYDDENVALGRAEPTTPQAPVRGVNTVGSILGMGQPYSKRKKRLIIRFDPCDTYKIFLDPYGEDMYVIHEIDMDYHRFYELAEKGKFDLDVAKKIHEDYFKLEDADAESARKGQSPTSGASSGNPGYRKRVRLDEFWGTLLSPRGKTMFKNTYGVMVNEKYMARAPEPIRLPGKRHPFIIAPVIEKPFSTWHQGFIENVASIQVMLTDLMNMIVDSNLYATVKSFELDIDQVYDPTQFQDGIYPGKTYKKRGGGFNSAPMIKDITLGQVPAQAVDVFTALDREFQGGLGLNEFIMPQQRMRTGRVTATEVAQKGDNSTEFFGDIARGQEENILEPLLQKAFGYIVAYQRDFSDPLMMEIMGKEAAMKASLLMNNNKVRDFLLSTPIIFKANGMSTQASRMRELEKVMAFLNLVGNMAKGVPEVIKAVNVPELLKMGVYALNWDPTKVLTIPVDEPAIPPAGEEAGPTPVGQPPVGAPPGLDLGMTGASGPEGMLKIPRMMTGGV